MVRAHWAEWVRDFLRQAGLQWSGNAEKISTAAVQFNKYLIITSNKNGIYQVKANSHKATHLTKRTSRASTINRSDQLDCRRKTPAPLKTRPGLIQLKSNNRMRWTQFQINCSEEVEVHTKRLFSRGIQPGYKHNKTQWVAKPISA